VFYKENLVSIASQEINFPGPSRHPDHESFLHLTQVELFLQSHLARWC